MKRILCLIGLVLTCPSFGQVNFRYVKRGIQIPNWTTISALELNTYKQQGYDHVRIVPRANANYPGGGLPPVIKFTNDQLYQMEIFIWKAIAGGFRVILATESTSQENTNLFNDLRLNNNPKRFDDFEKQIAELVKRTDNTRVIHELFPEPGWFMRDTTPLNLGNHPAQRLYASTYLKQWLDYEIPLLRNIEPNLTFLLPTVGWGSPTGPGAYQDLNPGKWVNARQDFHFYSPRDLTHTGQNGTYIKPFIWPDFDGQWKSLVTDVNTANYEFNYKPWTLDGLKSMYSEVTTWCTNHNTKPFFSECGTLIENRNTPASIAYINDIRLVLVDGFTEWNK